MGTGWQDSKLGEKQSGLEGSMGTEFNWRPVTYVAPAGLIVGMMLINILKDLDDVTEHTLSMLGNDIKLGIVVGTKERK